MSTKLIYTTDIGITASSEESKWQQLVDQGKIYNTNYLIEFGTYLGHGCNYFAPNFDEVLSVEPVLHYYNLAVPYNSKNNNVTIVNEKSMTVLENLDIKNLLNKKVLFYLDGHAQLPHTDGAENSLEKEVKYIFNNLSNLDFILVIDDFRCWDQWCNKPELITFLESVCDYLVHDTDVIIAVPS